VKNNSKTLSFRASPAMIRKIEAAMNAMETDNKSEVLEKALECGLDLLHVSDYEPTRLLLKLAVQAKTKSASSLTAIVDPSRTKLCEAK
jgi:saccharopine dehydrogenase-like NADP-dependent oxidoreductase